MTLETTFSREDVRFTLRSIKLQAERLMKLLPVKDRNEPITQNIAIEMLEVREWIKVHSEIFSKKADEVVSQLVIPLISDGNIEAHAAVQKAKKTFYDALFSGKPSELVEQKKASEIDSRSVGRTV